MYKQLEADLVISEYDSLYYQDEAKVKTKREAAYNYVKDFVSRDIEKQLLHIGIDDNLISDFLNKDKSAINKLLKIIKENKDEFELSLNNISTVTNLSSVDGREAWETLNEFIIKKQFRMLCDKAGLTPKSRNEFQKHIVRPEEKTQIKLSKAMNLSDEETEHFKSLFLKSFFPLTVELKKKTRNMCANSQNSITDFLNSCNVSQSTWEKITNYKKTNDVISQNILLKFANGFGVDENKAKEYMSLAGSGFYTSYDIVFLVCIRLGYYEYYQVCEAMDLLF